MKHYDVVFGVPCSKLKKFIDRIEHYIPCTKEDEAMALAAGAYLAGKRPLVFLQNSGLGNIVDIVTSLIKPYGMSVSLLISLRNKPEHHAFMGSITVKLLELLEYKDYRIFDENEED
ncbi:MAG: thiamine pyrophosphate-binding protein [Candidatus Omnitrophota bacterium]|jgi:phosphonopyruvate decarboxylase